jgi:hypothetical protein
MKCVLTVSSPCREKTKALQDVRLTRLSCWSWISDELGLR